jgi:hypothetical protein
MPPPDPAEAYSPPPDDPPDTKRISTVPVVGIVTLPLPVHLYIVLLPDGVTEGDPVVLETEAFGLPLPPEEITQVDAAVFRRVADEYCASVVDEPETVDAVPAAAIDQDAVPALYKPMMVPVAKLYVASRGTMTVPAPFNRTISPEFALPRV